MPKAFITGLSGLTLTAPERAFLAAEQPAGLILFTRNCDSRDQIRALTCAFRDAVGTDRVPVLVDQEGGRVQRLRPPLARALPPAAALAGLWGVDRPRAEAAARALARLTADELTALGINTNCVPVLDVPVPGAHDIIGDRAYGSTPDQIVALGGAVAAGCMDRGVLPVMKHIPGHGRATADSHLELPVVTASRAELGASDFVPFERLATLPAAMTAHVVYTALDPQAPASTSRHVITQVIRQHLRFDGLLMSDDLSMQALTGTMRARTRGVLEAGSDLALHCNGNFDEMRQVADACAMLEGAALARFERALAVTDAPRQPYDTDAARATLERVASDFALAAKSV
jgi:beta-N-acetylhexosaminidase